MTKQMQSSKGLMKTDRWGDIMTNPTISKNQSEIFVKKLVALGMSNLTYIRGLFPENVYVNKQLEGIRLKILRDDKNCGTASKLISWLKGAFEAFSNRYLSQLIFAIHEDEAGQDDVLETYSFYFTYKENYLNSCNVQREKQPEIKISSDINCSLVEVRKSTLEMLRTTIQLTQSLPPLPDKCSISIKLLYFDDITPSDYEPPGFFSVHKSSFVFPREMINLKIGEVHTPFHSLKLKAKLQDVWFANMQKSYDTIQSYGVQNSRETKHIIDRDISLNQTADSQDLINSLSQVHEAGKLSDYAHIRKSEEMLSTPFQNSKQSVSVDIESDLEGMRISKEVCEEGISCACLIKKSGGLMVKCMFCNKWQHGACYGLLNQNEIPPIHVCILCHKPDDQRQCTDVKLLTLSVTQRQEICLYRRTLTCIDICRISLQFISQELGITEDIARLLFQLLDKDGILKKSKGSTRSVNMKVLIYEIMPCYFGSNTNFSLHKYIFNLQDSMADNIKNINDISITQETSIYKRNKRMNYIIEKDEPVSQKKQKCSRGKN